MVYNKKESEQPTKNQKPRDITQSIYYTLVRCMFKTAYLYMYYT